MFFNLSLQYNTKQTSVRGKKFKMKRFQSSFLSWKVSMDMVNHGGGKGIWKEDECDPLDVQLLTTLVSDWGGKQTAAAAPPFPPNLCRSNQKHMAPYNDFSVVLRSRAGLRGSCRHQFAATIIQGTDNNTNHMSLVRDRKGKNNRLATTMELISKI